MRAERAVVVTPVAYFADPGFQEWVVTARARGTAIVRSVAEPACTGCATSRRSFCVTIVVA
jgi:hypothetical protein